MFYASSADLLRRTITENRYIPALGGKFPSVQQAVFLTAPCKEILYGGAAGGGKSAALLAGALQYVDCPQYHSLLLRRSFADLSKQGGLIQLSVEWLAGTDAHYNQQDHRWTFPSGATLSFGYGLNLKTLMTDFQGTAFAYIGIDELTQWLMQMYRFMYRSLRVPIGVPFPVRMRTTSNPGGEGHEWVKSRFIDGADGKRRMFIPAKLEDNPGLDREQYDESLAELDPVTRRQLRHGDWEVRPEGEMFKREWFAGKILDAPPQSSRRVRYWDLAATKPKEGKDPDFASGCLMSTDGFGHYCVEDMQHFRESPQTTEARVKMTADLDGPNVSIRIEQEPGAASKLYIDALARSMSRFDVRGVPSAADKVTRARPFSAACERGDVTIVRGAWVAAFLDELCAFPEVAHDDQVDGGAGAYNDLASAATLDVRLLGEPREGPKTRAEVNKINERQWTVFQTS